MYINFKCKDCGASFRILETVFYKKDVLQCPDCGEKVDPNFMTKLFEFCVDRNSQLFDVTFSSTPQIKSQEIINSAIKVCSITLKNKHKNLKLDTLDDFSTALKSEHALEIVVGLIDSAIYCYHQKLQENFEIMGIDIGDMV